MAQGEPRQSGQFQVRLLDLIVVVVGASYVLDVARRSRLAWGGGMPDFSHAAGLTVLTLGVCVGLVVGGQWVGRLRRRDGRAWALAWRVAATGWLAGAMVEVAGALQETRGATVRFGDLGAMRLRLATLMSALGMVGLILAAAPLGPRRARALARSRWGSWPSVTWAAVVGILIVGLGFMILPYLVVLALEFVRQAMTRVPLAPRPIVFDRMTRAGLEALPGLLGCLATAAWVDDDLRAAATQPLDARAARPWRGVIARASTVALAASASGYVVLYSIPELDPWLAEGLAAAFGPSLIATIALGFAALAAGISARGAAHLAGGIVPDGRPAGREPLWRRSGPWPRRVIGGVVALACLAVTAAALKAIRPDLATGLAVPIDFDAWMSIFRQPWEWLGAPASGGGRTMPIDHLDEWLIGGVAAWMAVRIALLIGPGPSGQPSALDSVAVDRLALGRFLGWWTGLTTLMLASLPILAVLALNLIHFAVRWIAK